MAPAHCAAAARRSSVPGGVVTEVAWPSALTVTVISAVPVTGPLRL